MFQFRNLYIQSNPKKLRNIYRKRLQNLKRDMHLLTKWVEILKRKEKRGKSFKYKILASNFLRYYSIKNFFDTIHWIGNTGIRIID